MPSQTGPVLVVGYTMAMQKALDKFMPDDSWRVRRRADRWPASGTPPRT